MKNILFIHLLCLLLFACSQKDKSFHIYNIDIRSNQLLIGEILLSGTDSCLYYDLQITDSFWVFLDYKSDTVIQVFEHSSKLDRPYSYALRGKDKNEFFNPEFTKSISFQNNVVSLVDDKLFFKEIALDKKENDCISSVSKTKLIGENGVHDLIRSIEYNYTEQELYAVSLGKNVISQFYFFNPDSGYYWVDPYPKVNIPFPEKSVLYKTNLCVNERKKSIVSALRLMNNLQFYNLRGEMLSAVTFGDSLFFPKIDANNKAIDILNSTKHFINVYGTSKYVYCLYDGSPNYSNQSMILIFNWEGKHITTLQVDRNLRKMAIDKADSYIIAIASNEEGGRDVIKYSLNKVL